MSKKRQEVDEKYDYRYSVLIFVFARLLREGWLDEFELDGLQEDKISARFGQGGPRVEVVCAPGPYQPQQSAGRRRGLLEEFRKRAGDHNVGGGTKRPLVTAYREEALRLADDLRRRGTATVKELREASGLDKAGDILGDNFYGWFERVARGVYWLTDAGEKALEIYIDVVKGFKAGQVPKEVSSTVANAQKLPKVVEY